MSAQPSLTSLETPFALVDAGIVEANTRRMRARLSALGVAMRPHVKTAKSLPVALLACGGAIGPITVSTLKEAEQFAAAGFADILYAVGITPQKLAHATALRRQGVDLKLITDNAASAAAIAASVEATGIALPTLIEIDVDGHRSGIKPEAAGDLLAVSRALDAQSPLLAGVMTHAGASYDCASTAAIEAMAEQERRGIVQAAETLRHAGFACTTVSVGSTPTATLGKRFDGVTEVRAGVYVFHDLVMAGLAVCDLRDIAFSVVATVIGHQPDRGWIVTDAGWMALSRDRGTAKQTIDYGYGLVCDIDGIPLPDMIVQSANQEHGIVAHRNGGAVNLAEYPVGRMLRVLPNHACATAAQYDEYKVVRGNQAIEARWPRFSGW
jgi:D-serine deaminase-like pyridoxal phosphate-dependent protein